MKKTLTMIMAIVALTVLNGCGGGGGGSSVSPGASPISPGNGRAAFELHFSSRAANRATDATSGTVSITITVTGDYGVDDAAFPPVTASTQIDASGGHGTVSMLEIPIGVNHLMTAIATWQDGTTDTIKYIIPEIKEGELTKGAVDYRTTIIADAAIALADRDKIKLSKVSKSQIDNLAAAVDAFLTAGYAPDDINMNDVLAYETTGNVLATIDVSPATATVHTGATAQFTATPKNAYGIAIAETVTWSVTGGIGTINSSGLFTATTASSGTVVATTGTVSGSSEVTVTVTSGTVTGYVYNTSPGSTPVSGAAVTCSTISSTTDAVGAYNLSNVPSGVHTCSVAKSGYDTSSFSVTVTAGQATSAPPVTLMPTSTAAVCGNGIIESGETCDDGNTVTETCTYGQTSCTVCNSSCQSAAGATSYCGDTVTDGTNGETCDDGANNGQPNYCNSSCNGITSATCGNGTTESGETCDDDGESAACDTDCTAAACGDNATNATAGETCDDGNATTESCTYGQTSCTICNSACQSAAGATSYCGDSIVNGTETCDDGNAVTETCTYGETSCTVCNSTCQSVTSATSYCGDSVTDGTNGETCDNGANNGQPNYCNATCNGTTGSVCGNSVVESGETCDDGNTTTESCTYGQTSCTVCNSSCSSAAGAVSYCGDNIVNGTETCDDGNAVTETCTYGQTSCSICNSSCASAAGAASFCGDSTTDAANGETCDDGNTTGGDGCSATCQNDAKDTNAWITIPAGDFVMGCATADTYCSSSESPKHTVTLFEYKIQKYEVSNAQYAACVAATVCTAPSSSNSSTHTPYYGNATYDNYPVIYVDWNKASAYCAWIGGRLPTEAEWEKAARGPYPAEPIYPWGDGTATCSLANYYGCTGDTDEVGGYPTGVSYYGVTDMAGNVGEWVNDWYASDYYTTGGPPWTDPQGPGAGTSRGVRTNGAWAADPLYNRVSIRSWGLPSYDQSDLGIRCAQDAGVSGPVCGNGTLEQSETCDDGANNGTPNYCNATCDGMVPATCGNSVVESGETCDDGNTTTETCTYGQTSCSVCDSVCATVAGTTSYCGDSTTDGTNGETCDDGNTAGGDGCSAACTTETIATNAWITIPAGDFVMGCATADVNCQADESPKHTVTLSEYKIQKYEVTNAQYKACVDMSTCTVPSSSDSSTRIPYYGNATYDNYPVIYVDWNQASAYCVWIGGRLPTEAEWEKSARGPSPAEPIYPWGDSPVTCTQANFLGCTGDTDEVGSHPTGASYYGIMDMAGNEWEWVNDWYDGTYYTTGGPPWTDPQGAGSGTFRVQRGGVWSLSSLYVRTSRRYFNSPGQSANYSFRCAQD